MPPTTTDAELVTRAASGDQQAFRLLYRAHVTPVYWIAYGIVRTPADAEEIVQETFVTAWRKLPGLLLSGDSLLPWLATICRFHTANRMRQRARTRENEQSVDDELADSIDVADLVITRDWAERIIDELRGFSDIDQQIFVLCACEGYSYDAAADTLQLTHGQVRNRLSRVRSRLREKVNETTVNETETP
ncbi:RNA polymerase sigma factor [Microbacterium sp. YY-01]|uniref:RNA polymerase sigma factor n=1 Tax=Microbacterium sp. YY-01 TaxID=3421634 RepID=UPI003D17C1F8